MARFSATNICLLLLAWSACLTAGLTVEEQLQQLREETQVLTTKVTQLGRLEEKVNKLEAEKVQLEHALHSTLRNQRSSNGGIENQSTSNKESTIYRTCQELRSNDPLLPSGLYPIDPDGQGSGDGPIYVYCNMTTGSSSVLHDNEDTFDIPFCVDPGCYSRNINYNATLKQIAALADWSEECHQSFSYECNSSPFEYFGLDYIWWNDRDGNKQTFWAGSNSSTHTCQCGLDGSCVEYAAGRRCNCDSNFPQLFSDNGFITEKTLLPVTQLFFGRALTIGRPTLGRFTCKGNPSVNGMPKSCVDLLRIGHTLTGLYSVAGEGRVESVYCDFAKLSTDPNFETRMGFEDVKSTAVHFYVQRNTAGFAGTTGPIPFELEKLNTGGAMNVTSGIFTAPVTGTYFFGFSGLVKATGNSGYLTVALKTNTEQVGAAWGQSPSVNHYAATSLQSTIKLQAGDDVWLQITTLASSNLHESADHFNHFTGWLLEEELFSSK